MKKILTGLLALLIFAAANAQSSKNIPPPPPPKPPKVDITKFVPPTSVIQEFIKRNPSVAHIEWSNSEKINIKLKDGTTETYDLGNENDKKTFTEKYGVPPLPPPPPPAPPKKPKEIS